jgi:hypothetical protein
LKWPILRDQASKVAPLSGFNAGQCILKNDDAQRLCTMTTSAPCWRNCAALLTAINTARATRSLEKHGRIRLAGKVEELSFKPVYAGIKMIFQSAACNMASRRRVNNLAISLLLGARKNGRDKTVRPA